MAWASLPAELLWRNAWAVIPLAAIVAIGCRCVPLRPATRHMLWLIVLLGFVAPLALPELPTPEILRSRTIVASTPKLADSRAPDTDVAAPEEVSASGAVGESATSPEAVARTEPRVPGWLPPTPGSVELLLRGGESPPVTAPTPKARFRVQPPAAESAGLNRPAGNPPFSDLGNHRLTRRSPCEHGASRDKQVAGAPLRSNENATAGGEHDGHRHTNAAAAEVSETNEQQYTWWHPWLVALFAIRDAIGRLPTLPPGVWATGFGLVLLIQLARLLRFRRRLRKARPAPPTVARAAAELAASFGLRRAPETLMLRDCVSPMIWCGRRPRLLLPERLWRQLDQPGRNAIVCHELAHLRRGDHWIRWIELLIAALYWWHPVVWWVRRRLHEEADLCCDAWVTWLMPERRRAYAEALLRTKQFVSDGSTAVPAVGITVTSVGARRFARRLTMVMTRSVRPRASLAGIVLAFGLASIGWSTLPAWACPPKEKQAECKKHEVTTEVTVKPAAELAVWDNDKSFKTYVQRNANPLSRSVSDAVSIAVGGPLSTFLATSCGAGEEDELERRLEQLQRELERLAEQLDELRTLSRARRGPEALVAPPGVPTLPMPPKPPALPAPATPPSPPALPGAPAFRVPSIRIGDDGIVVRSYYLPKGKLAALTELMVRQDVPILVSPHDDRIDVHATERQHQRFKAFVDLIHPSGKGDVRDRPTYRRPPELRAHAGAVGQFKQALEAKTEAVDQLREALKQLQRSRLEKELRSDLEGTLRDTLRTLRDEHQGSLATQTAALGALLGRFRTEASSHRQEAAAVAAQAKALEREAEALQVKAGALAAQARALARAAKDGEKAADSEAATFHAEARALDRQSKELERIAHELEKRARAIERQAEQADESADELSGNANKLEKALRLLNKLTGDKTER